MLLMMVMGRLGLEAAHSPLMIHCERQLCKFARSVETQVTISMMIASGSDGEHRDLGQYSNDADGSGRDREERHEEVSNAAHYQRNRGGDDGFKRTA